METMVINVQGMSCNHCKNAVEQQLEKVDGVTKAEVNLEAKNVAVSYDAGKVSLVDLKKAITEAGFEPQ